MKKSIIAILLVLSGQSFAASTGANIQVQATLNPTCSISSQNLSFGLIGVSSGNVTSASANLSLKCSNKLAYTVGISSGLYGNSTMKGSSKGDSINYALCKQTGYSISGTMVNCNNSWISSTLTGTGNGTNQSYQMTGYILNGFYTPDNYSDSVTATIWY